MSTTTLSNHKVETRENASEKFLHEVLEGLSAPEKYLNSKYFYDAIGDQIFQKIMACPEYYLTRCEMEIFTQQTQQIANTLSQQHSDFDLVELGAGDATKSFYLLEQLIKNKTSFTYLPVDISKNVISHLKKELPKKLPALQMHGLNGEYFEMLDEAKRISTKRKVVLFLGGNIGNVPLDKVEDFCKQLRNHLNVGDMVLIGFDLKKDPEIILSAYNDKGGLTRDFNLNLLRRMNKELHANFEIDQFKHYPTYDPATGTCKSYLISSRNQKVNLGDTLIYFDESEAIHTETSQKYTTEQIDELAHNSGFSVAHNFYDSKHWFVDSVWQV